MGCIASGPVEQREENSKNAVIEKAMKSEKKQDNKVVKLLLIGTGDSGKTTLRKQMRNIYGSGFDQASRLATREIIFENIVSGARQVMNYSVGSVDDSTSREKHIKEKFGASGEIVYELSTQTEIRVLSPDQVAALKDLWLNSAPFKEAYAQRTKYHLQDCWTAFVTSLSSDYPTWGGPDWVPSIDDCVRSRVRTSGISEETFVIDNVSFKLFDCGGQRAERKKWIHFFENVTSVIFVASLCEYDLYLFEDSTVSRLKESLELFSDMCNSKYFKAVPMILFLNKRDLFEQKYLVDHVPLNATGEFPNAPTGDDINVAIDWITNLYLSKNLNPNKQVYTHVTTAVDPDNVRAVFDTCKNIILQKNLSNIGFIPE